MAVDPGHGRHGEGGQAREELEEGVGVEAGGVDGMVEVEAVAVELADSRRGDDDPGRQFDLDDVEGEDEGLAEVGAQTVVGRGGEG